jgi:hypothetical protein
LLSKGVIVARRTKEENRYCWHYTVNLEKTESVQKQNAPLKDTVSFTAYLKNENYEIEPIHIVTFNHLLEVKKQIHLDYDNYKNHFRNWLPTYLAYKEKGRKLKLTSKKEDKDKCGTNKVFNILRIKIKNPQADYMTYQGWVNDLCNIDGTDLSDADNDFKRTILAHKINGTLLNEYKTNYKPKNTK